MTLLKRLLPVLLLLLAVPGFAATLKPYAADYDVITHGVRAGVAKFQLEKLGKDRWRFKSDSHATGLVSLFRDDVISESSVFTIADSGEFSAREYRYSHTGDDERTQSILFDWKHDVAHSTYRGDEKKIDIPKGASDPFLAQLKLSRSVAGGMDAGSFPVVNRNELEVYHLKVVGRDAISVPAGAFTAVRVERSEPGSIRKTIFWLAPKLNYVPVKVAQIKDGDPVFRLELRSIQFGKK
ncbi:MAG TPA: DUF3108 domain-containing protein [Gammaproteobacteria bacterium]|nr:DUF3108 domain-containing protein [Gammaproteobacteria bacterium]